MTSPNVIASYKQPGSPVEVMFDPTNFAGNIWFVNNSNSAATDSTGYGRTPPRQIEDGVPPYLFVSARRTGS